MRRSIKSDGNAVVEFIVVVVVLLLPVTYGIVALAQLQSAVVGVSGAAQMAARAYAQASTDLVGRYAAARSAAIAGRNHGLSITSDQVRVECGAADCLLPGTRVRVTIDTPLRINIAPFARVIPLHAEQVLTVDPYRAVANG